MLCYFWDCCSVAKSCPTLYDPMDCNTPGFPVLHYLLEFAQAPVHWVGDAIQPGHPLSPFCLPALNLSQKLDFKKYYDFHLSLSPPMSSGWSQLPCHGLSYGKAHRARNWVSLVAQRVKSLPAMQETWVQSSGREDSPGEGNGNPLQYPCLENSMDCIRQLRWWILCLFYHN